MKIKLKDKKYLDEKFQNFYSCLYWFNIFKNERKILLFIWQKIKIKIGRRKKAKS